MKFKIHLRKHLEQKFIIAGLQKTLIKEYNDYLILDTYKVFRDWIVSRYLDKILEQVKALN